jgi:hypothetical protein
MKYFNGGKYIEILDTTVLYNGIEYIILNSDSNSTGNTRLTFDKYMIKISNNKLSLYDVKNSTLIETYSSESSQKSNNNEIWWTYILKKNVYISLNIEKNLIKMYDVDFDIKSKYKDGNSTVYVAENGKLRISNNVNTWNNVSIMKI